MSDIQVDLAKAVVSAIDGATLPATVNVERAYRISTVETKDLDICQIRVVNGPREGKSLRREAERQLTILVGMVLRLDSTDPITSGDAANELAMAVEDLFLGQALSGIDDTDRRYSFLESKFETPFDAEMAKDEHIFATLLALTYRYAHGIS